MFTFYVYIKIEKLFLFLFYYAWNYVHNKVEIKYLSYDIYIFKKIYMY